MEITVTKTLTSSKEAVWKNLKNFAGVQNYHPTVTVSKSLNGKEFGMGAERSCTFTDGNTIKERIVDYTENEGYKVDIIDFGKMPIKYAQAHLGIREAANGANEVFMSMNFKAKMGPLGWVMERVMMKKSFIKLVTGVLDGLDSYSETGIPVRA